VRSLLSWIGHPRPPSPSYRAPISSSTGSESSMPSPRLSESMMSRFLIDNLVESYFTVFHVTYPLIHEATFKAQYRGTRSRPRQRSWDTLFYAVLGLGAWCLGNEDNAFDEHLYRRALFLGDDEPVFDTANLSTVQALLLLSNLNQKLNRPNTGWNCLGLAKRMALSLGLHRELPEWNITPFQREMRRRIWWCLYMFDSGASTTFGRAILLPGRDVMDVSYVSNVGDVVGKCCGRLWSLG